MKRILGGILAVGIAACPVVATVGVALPSLAQDEAMPATQLLKLLEQAFQQAEQGKTRKAIATWQKVVAEVDNHQLQSLTKAQKQKFLQLKSLALLGIGFNYNRIGERSLALEAYEEARLIYEFLNDYDGETTILNNIGGVYNAIGQRQKALSYYERALSISQEIGDRDGEATTLNNIGTAYSSFGKTQEAFSYCERALSIYQEIGDLDGEAATLSNIGTIYEALGRRQEALSYHERALSIHQEIGDLDGEATTLNNIGIVYHAIGHRQKALSYYERALSIRQEIGDLDGEATTLNNIGGTYDDMGHKLEALSYYNIALSIRQEISDRDGEANTIHNIAALYNAIGRRQEALNYYEQALSIRQEIGDRDGEATTLNNIGTVYEALGRKQEALNYYQQSLSIHQQTGNRPGKATNLHNIGGIYYTIGQLQESFRYFTQSLLTFQEVGDLDGKADTLNNIGVIYNDLGQQQEALEIHNQALVIFKRVDDREGEASTLNNIGVLYDTLRQSQEALKYYNQALPIRREVGDLLGEAVTLSNIGLVYRDTNQPGKAIVFLEESVEITLELRSQLKREHRQSFSQSNRGPDVALISLLIDENQADRAFEWLHRTTTADLADYTKLIDAKVSADANSEVQKAVDEWNRRYYEIQFLNNDLQENFSEDKSRQLNQNWAELRTHEQDIIENFPEVAELFETQPTDIAKLRNSIPKDTVLLQPTLLTGVENVENEIALFVVTRDSLDVVKVPIDPDAFDSLLSEYRQQLTNPNRLDYANNQKQLYDWFIRPVEDKIRAASPKSLAIIATGKLRYIPFETFRDRETNAYLIDKYPVYYLTRISTRSLASQTDPFPWRAIGIGAMIIIAVYSRVGIAHPTKIRTIALVIAGLGTIALLLFPSTDSRVLGLGNPVPNGKQNLPATEEEVNNIAKMMRGSAAFLRQDATLDRFQTNAPNFSILHLATHGCFQELGCENIGMDANTLLFADTQFHIRDAILLGLENTDLIALSACQTAMETYSDGREISGMAYILERAGANAVMATLWSVADESSKDLAIAFYRHAKQRNNKAAALRQAKLELREQDAHPYFWSPLVLIGEGN